MDRQEKNMQAVWQQTDASVKAHITKLSAAKC